MYQSFSSLSIPQGSASYNCPSGRVFAQPSLPGRGGVGVLKWKNFLQFWKKNAGTSRFFSKNRDQLEKQVFLCCFMSIFAKTVDVYCIFNPITYGGGGGGFLARTIRLSTTTLKRLYLAPPNLVTFCFYLLDTLWQNFSKIDLPGGLLQLFLKWDVSKNWTYEIFVFAWKQWKYRRGYNFVPEKVFPGIKSDFCRILLESRR